MAVTFRFEGPTGCPAGCSTHEEKNGSDQEKEEEQEEEEAAEEEIRY